MKSLKTVLIVIGAVISVVVLDTLQARLLKNSPIISFKEELGGDSYVDKGILVDTYYCVRHQDIMTVSWHFKFTKFACNNESRYLDEKQFFGKVIESNESYIILEPDIHSDERKIADKFYVKLNEKNDAIYMVGTNVKITYNGLVNESYPAQISALKVEIKKTNFDLIFNLEPGNVKRQIIDKNVNKKYDYNVFVYNGVVEIIIDDIKYNLENALNSDKISMEEILAKIEQNNDSSMIYKDGGSIVYYCNNYTVIKLHTLDGNRDVYIGNKNLKLEDIKK